MTDGASSACPSASTRTAWTSSSAGASFTRKPLAPARRASMMYSSMSYVVMTSTRGGVRSAWATICRVASMPSMIGIRTSITMTAGRRRWAMPDGLGAIGRLADDGQVGFGLQAGAQGSPHEGLVVGDQHGDRHGTGFSTSCMSGSRRFRGRVFPARRSRPPPAAAPTPGSPAPPGGRPDRRRASPRAAAC